MPKSGNFIRMLHSSAPWPSLSRSSRSATAGASPAKQSGTTLSGAGSTFVAPLVAQWIPAVGARLRLRAAVQRRSARAAASRPITARTVDFGASDAPLTPDQFTACNGCVQIPWALVGDRRSCTTSPGVKNLLHMDGPTLAKIFMGQITTWNDPAIKKLNKGVNLPSTKITIVHRSDNSGTTYNFTDYLSSVSPAWKSQIGNGVAVNWPVGIGGKGSSGVAAVVAQTPGAIGYADVAYALQNHFKLLRDEEPLRQVRDAGAEGHPRRRDERPEARRDDERALDREPAEEVPARVSDLDVHLRDRRRRSRQGGRPAEVPLLGGHEGPDATGRSCSSQPIPKPVLVVAEKTITKIHS